MTLRSFRLEILGGLLLLTPAFAQHGVAPRDNAALRYWTAFAQMQDVTLNDRDAKQLAATVNGDVAYDDAKYGDLVEQNRDALASLQRGVTFAICDWGLDYQLGEKLPVEYARKALALGRLNVLAAYHQQAAGDSAHAASTLASGLRFSQDTANGGSLFATLAAKSLLVAHLRATASLLHSTSLLATERAVLRNALTRLGSEPLDWQSASRRDLAALQQHFAQDSAASAALERVASAYTSAVAAPAMLPALERALNSAPPQVGEVIPSAKRLLEEKQALADQLARVRAMAR
jgi:hypothetical protein